MHANQTEEINDMIHKTAVDSELKELAAKAGKGKDYLSIPEAQ